MKVIVRADKVTIDGYVNAVERFSKPLVDNRGKFIERIMPGAFNRALGKNKNVLGLLNHWPQHEIASQAEGTLKLVEDNIGLRATIETTDKRVMEKARAGKLRGWSFGFSEPVQSFATGTDGMEERTITELHLAEVSVLDDEKVPAYYGTSVEMRGADENDPIVVEYRAMEAEAECVIIRDEEAGDPSEAADDKDKPNGGEGGEPNKDIEKDPPATDDRSVLNAKVSKLKQEG